jgi:uracil-DNA glycosylase family 4
VLSLVASPSQTASKRYPRALERPKILVAIDVVRNRFNKVRPKVETVSQLARISANSASPVTKEETKIEPPAASKVALIAQIQTQSDEKITGKDIETMSQPRDISTIAIGRDSKTRKERYNVYNVLYSNNDFCSNAKDDKTKLLSNDIARNARIETKTLSEESAQGAPEAKNEQSKVIIDKLSEEQCQQCTLKDGILVSGCGTCENGVMLVGEAPGEVETEQGLPFVGDAGKKLNEFLNLAKIERSKCYVTNVVKCRPPHNRDPKSSEIKLCRKHLERELALYQPKLIITLGRFALAAFLPDESLQKQHGKRLPFGAATLIAMYHPAAALHNPKKLSMLQGDFKALSGVSSEDSTQVTTVSAILFDSPFSVDVETTGTERQAELVCAAFSVHDKEAYYSEASFVVAVLEHNLDYPMIFFNAKFDLRVLADAGLDYHRAKRIDDAMILGQLMGRYGKLSELALQYLNIRLLQYDEVCTKGKTLREASQERVSLYCGGHACATRALFNLFGSDASAQTLGVYEKIERPLVIVLTDMERRGMFVDVAYLEEQYRIMTEETDKQLQQLESFGLTQDVLNSPQQLGKILTEKFGLKIHKKTKVKKQSSVDKVTLARLAGQHESIDSVLKYRQTIKLRDTFVKGLLEAQHDGIVYPEFHQLGTDTGRLSASDPNPQNLPRGVTIRRAIVAPPGCVLLSMDASQIQLRILAYLAQDKVMLDVFRRGGDIHSETSDFLFGNHEKRNRDMAKNINFCAVFGGGFEKIMELAHDTKIEYDEARCFMESYFTRYQGVKRYLDKAKQDALRLGYADTFYGRRRYDNKVRSDIERIREAGIRELVNMSIQGTEADIIKLIMIAVNDVSNLILQVHDELIFVVEQDRVLQTYKNLREAVDALRIEIPVALNFKVGKNLGELKDLRQ